MKDLESTMSKLKQEKTKLISQHRLELYKHDTLVKAIGIAGNSYTKYDTGS